MNTNVFTVRGNLTKDPETRSTNSGNVTNFSMAHNGMKDGDVMFFKVAVWGKGGDAVQQYLTKGSGVIVTGRLAQEEYTAQDGTKRTSLVISANTVDFMPKNSGGESSGSSTRRDEPRRDKPADKQDEAQGDDDLPF